MFAAVIVGTVVVARAAYKVGRQRGLTDGEFYWKPYAEGALASVNGQPIESNPYQYGTSNHLFWIHGYKRLP